MQLQGQLAEFLSDEELEVESEKARATLLVMATLHVMQGEDPGAIRQALRQLIQSHPDTPAAAAAQRALEQLDAVEQPADDGESGDSDGSPPPRN